MERPSGLPRRSDREYNAFEDTDFAEALEGIPHCNGDLCEACDNIGFATFSDVLSPQSRITISLNKALERSSSCVFCCTVATAASKRQALLEATMQRNMECVVLPWETLRAESIQNQRYPIILIAVHVKSSKDPNDVPWLPEWFHDQPNRGESLNVELEFIEEDPLVVLEVVDQQTGDPNLRHGQHTDESTTDSGSEESDSEAAYIARSFPWSKGWKWRRFRKPIAPQIDFAHLKARLQNFDVEGNRQYWSEAPQKSNSTQSSLLRLINSSRLRLINVFTGDVDIVREQQPYVALSYVWGTLPMNRGAVVRSGYKFRPQVAWSIDWQLVPKTLRDAKEMVYQLGLKYLWVDALCIDQEDKEDKRAIIPEMVSIYGCAYVSINAIAGSDAHFGLPGVHADSRKPDIHLCFANRGRDVCLVPKRPSEFSMVQHSIWNTRAWTCQEYLLSPRSIFVTEVETWAVVGNTVIGERYATRRLQSAAEVSEIKDDTSKAQVTKLTAHEALIRPEQPVWSHYGDVVVTYSRRNLTNLGDRLAAFLGVFNRFCEDSDVPGDNLTWSGLPQQWFYAALLWEPVYTNLQLVRIGFDVAQSRALPSWSWVGWSGPIKLHESRLSSKTQAVRAYIMDSANIRCESLTLDTFNIWPFEPSPCTTPPSEGIILHLWATRIELYITARPIPNAYRVVHRDADSTGDIFLGTFELEPSTASRLCNRQKQDFIIFGRLFMLVEIKDDFYERRAIGKFLYFEHTLDGSDAAQRITSCVERLGILEYIKLR